MYVYIHSCTFMYTFAQITLQKHLGIYLGYVLLSQNIRSAKELCLGRCVVLNAGS